MTILLRRAASGDASALERLAPMVMAELRAIARSALRKERPGHILQPTLLADEAFMRLAGKSEISWQNRSHFYALAAKLIRRLLVDHARAHRRLKRGGNGERIDLAIVNPAARGMDQLDMIALDEAMKRLEALDPRQASIVELKHFSPLTIQEIAALLDVSVRTVDGDWAMARAWLRTQLCPEGDH